MSLSEAVLDLKTEAVSGKSVTDALIAEIASFYEVATSRLKAAFEANYSDLDAIRKTAAATDPATAARAKVAAKIDHYLAIYDAKAIHQRDVFFKIDRYTVIGRISRTHLLAVRHSDGTGWKLPAHKVVAA